MGPKALIDCNGCLNEVVHLHRYVHDNVVRALLYMILVWEFGQQLVILCTGSVYCSLRILVEVLHIALPHRHVRYDQDVLTLRLVPLVFTSLHEIEIDLTSGDTKAGPVRSGRQLVLWP